MRSLKSALALSGLLLMTARAEATPTFSGSFTAIGTVTVGPTGTPVPNTPISGTFSDDAGTCTTGITFGGLGPGTVLCDTPDLVLTFNFLGGITVNRGQGSILLSNPPSEQILTLDYGYRFQTEEQRLTFVGPPNAFVDNGDFQTLHPGPVDLANSQLSIDYGSSGQANAVLTSVTFNAIPEPSSLAALLSVLATLVATRSRRRPSQVPLDLQVSK